MAGGGLGDLEKLALLAVMRLGEGAYAVSVRREIEERTGRVVSRGAVYTTLDRLRRKGYLGSAMSEPTPERGGKAKRIFWVTAPGVASLQSALDGISSLLDGLEDQLAWKARA